MTADDLLLGPTTLPRTLSRRLAEHGYGPDGKPLAEIDLREPGGFAESPPPTSEQLRTCVLLLRDLADALVWCDQQPRDHAIECHCVDAVPDEAYEVLDRLLPYRSRSGAES